MSKNQDTKIVKINTECLCYFLMQKYHHDIVWWFSVLFTHAIEKFEKSTIT